MSLSFGAIIPHPLSAKSELQRSSKTIESIEILSKEIESIGIETILIITPHMPVNLNSFSIVESSRLVGDFRQFGDLKNKVTAKNDLKLVADIKKGAAFERIPLSSFNDPKMDYGVSIPLYLLNTKVKVTPLGVSGLSPREHLNFGRIIARVIEKSKSKIGVIASANLSQKLSPGLSGGYSPKGKDVDSMIVKSIEKGDAEAIAKILDRPTVCGYLPMMILFGIFEKTKWKGEVLSYESPFGTGQMTARIKR